MWALLRILVPFVLAASSSANADDLITYKCHYDKYSDGESIKRTSEPFELTFVTSPKGEATMVGNNGSSKVMGFWNQNGEGVSFVEVTPVGNIMTTVIDSNRASIHSRHAILSGHVVPSQYYGRCLVQ